MDDPELVVRVDLGKVTRPDLTVIDALVRMQLLARRHGGSIELAHPCPELRDLIALVGLANVLTEVRDLRGECER